MSSESIEVRARSFEFTFRQNNPRRKSKSRILSPTVRVNTCYRCVSNVHGKVHKEWWNMNTQIVHLFRTGFGVQKRESEHVKCSGTKIEREWKLAVLHVSVGESEHKCDVLCSLSSCAMLSHARLLSLSGWPTPFFRYVLWDAVFKGCKSFPVRLRLIRTCKKILTADKHAAVGVVLHEHVLKLRSVRGMWNISQESIPQWWKAPAAHSCAIALWTTWSTPWP